MDDEIEDIAEIEVLEEPREENDQPREEIVQPRRMRRKFTWYNLFMQENSVSTSQSYKQFHITA